MTLAEALIAAITGIGLLCAGAWALILFYFSRLDRSQDKEEKAVKAMFFTLQKAVEKFEQVFSRSIDELEKKLELRTEQFNGTLHRHELDLQKLNQDAVSTRNDMGKIANKVQRWFDEWERSRVEQLPGGNVRITQRKKEHL